MGKCSKPKGNVEEEGVEFGCEGGNLDKKMQTIQMPSQNEFM